MDNTKHYVAPKIPYDDICQATKRHTLALLNIIKTYEPYINKLASKSVIDSYGNESTIVDDEAAGKMKEDLISSIFSFNPCVKNDKGDLVMNKDESDLNVNSERLQKYAFELAAFDFLLSRKVISRFEYDRCILLSKKEAGISTY